MATSRRRGFNAAAEQSTNDTPDEDDPRRLACKADRCPMPGTIFLGNASEGICGWHYGTNASDWPRITQVLTEWTCITSEIQAARRALSGPSGTDPRALRMRFDETLNRVRPNVASSGWGTHFEALPNEDYGDWARRMERFMHDMVLKMLQQGRLTP